MSDRDESTGQFAPTPEPLFGKEGIERDQGYVPFKEPSAEEPAEDLTVEQAAEQLSADRASGDVKTYSDLDLPDNVTLTIEDAAKIQTDMRKADEAQAELEEADRIRSEHDKLLGVDKAKAETKTDAEPANDESDIEKFLKNPRVREAVQKQDAEVERVKQTYTQGVDIAHDFARASFIENFPEIAQLPLEQWEGALAAMSQQEPDRFNKAVNTLQRVTQLQAAQQHQQQQKAFAEHQELQAFSKAESARFEESIKGISRQERRAVEDSIVESIKDAGGDTAEFFELMKSSKLLNSAVAQRILWAAGKYHQVQKATVKAAPKGLPPVQRPGSNNGPRASSNEGRIATLEKQLGSASGDKAARISAEIWKLERSARG